MLTASDWEPTVRMALEETTKAIDRLVANFAPKLKRWLNDLLSHPIPEDWRDELAAFVQRTADDDNLAIAPHSVAFLERLIESRIAGTGRFEKFGPARRVASRAISPPPSAASAAADAGGSPTQEMQRADRSQAASQGKAPVSEQVRIRASQIARAAQTQLDLSDAERASLEQYYKRVLSTGIAEPMPGFFKERLAERERRIAAQPAFVADTRTDEQRRADQLAAERRRAGGPLAAQAPIRPAATTGMTTAEIEKAEAELGKSVEDAAGKSFGVKGLAENPDGARNPRYWEEGPLDDEGDRPWVLRADLSDEEILAAFADTQSKAAGAACTNRMLCRRASSIVVINGFIGFFNKQPKEVRARGLRWIANVLRNAGGNVEDAMQVFTETIDDKHGIDPKNIRRGDQVHFDNPAYVEGKRGEEGKNAIARGPDSFANPYAGDPTEHSFHDIQVEIQGWTDDPKPDLGKITVDRIRRPALPRWYTDK